MLMHTINYISKWQLCKLWSKSSIWWCI